MSIRTWQKLAYPLCPLIHLRTRIEHLPGTQRLGMRVFGFIDFGKIHNPLGDPAAALAKAGRHPRDTNRKKFPLFPQH